MLDTFDGRFARCFERTSRQRRVGCEIDSLVDVCAFGMGPVVVLEGGLAVLRIVTSSHFHRLAS